MAPVLAPPDWYFLRRFLRARQHDLKRAKEMYAATVRWRAEFGTDTIMEDFHFHERDAFISLYPQGYHKTDKSVRVLWGGCSLLIQPRCMQRTHAHKTASSLSWLS